MRRVVIADDDHLMRAGLVELLTVDGTIHVVGQASTGRDAVSVVKRLRPDVVLMDVRMPEMDGITATRELAAAVPDTKVLILTTFEEDDYVFGALRSGASGFLLKRTRPEELIAATDLLGELTPREREVLDLIARGLSNREIAVALAVEESTIRTHVKRVLAKLRLRDRIQVVIYAYENGLTTARGDGPS
jgi:DNA-binding NarL/FixJ family response regulator